MKNKNNTILFIDSAIANPQELLSNIDTSSTKIVFLNSTTDALTQIAAALHNQKNLDAIHIISHGVSGELDFANGTLTSENLSQYAPLLKKIGQSLTPNGDILLYGCDIAKDEKGRDFVNLLAKLTHADIAASNDLTGSSALGGDWDLEVHSGKIESKVISAPNYQGLLAQDLINGLGGTSGFGENNYVHADDPLQATGINITSIFGAAGVKFGSSYYTKLFINNNGIVTFGEGTSSYTPNGLSAGVKNPGASSPYLPTLALYWSDLDTRAASTNVSPGGTSTGANLVHWDLDTVNKKITITWDDVAEYSAPQNSTTVLAAQMILTDAGNGNMNIEYRYEYVGELKSHTATAGWNAGVVNGTAGVDYYEIPLNTQVKLVGGNNVTALSDLDTRVGNSGQGGVFQFFLQNGGVTNKTLTYSSTNFIGDATGNVATTSTITLIGDTFAATAGTVLTGRVSNLPADLTATITINTATTATLSFSSTGRVFTDTDDRTNVTVTFANSDFTGGVASTVTNSTVTNLVVDFPNITPYFGTNNGLTLTKVDPTTAITNTLLNVLDPEQTATQLTYTVTTLPTKGTLLKNSVALPLNGTFTQDDINNSRLTFTPATEGTDNFKFSVSDGIATLANQTFNLTITAANTLHTGTPTISGNPWTGQTLTATEDSLVDVDGLTGLTWQWQSSSDGVTWNNINLATNATYVLTSSENGLLVRALASWGVGIYAESEISKFLSISPNFATVTDSPTVVEPIALPTTATSTSAVNVFDFTIHDGIADTLTTQVSEVKFNTSGNADFSKVTWQLSGNGITGSVVGAYDNVANTLTFPALNIAVPDNTDATYTVSAYYSTNTGLTEGQTYGLSLAPNTGLTIPAAGSTRLQVAQPVITNGTGSKVDVTATKLLFDTQPTGSVSGTNLTTQPVLKATDAAGNLDIDFIDTVTLTENSNGALSGTTSKVASSGIVTFNDISYTATADHETFQLSASTTGLATALSTVVDSNVIATKLEFSTQPSPTSLENGRTTIFTAVPVVRAVNAQNILDTDYNTAILLSVTDPTDGIVNGTVNSLTSTADTDLNATTVTQTPSSGSAIFSGLTLQYTSATANDSLVLQATSGSFSTVNSQTLTVSSIPFVTAINRVFTSPTNATLVDFALTFSENVSGVDVNDFALSTTTGISGASVSSVSGSGANYTVSVNTGSGDGTLSLDLSDDDSIFSSNSIRLGGVGLGNGSFSSGQTYSIDKTPPTLSINTVALDDKINAQEDDNPIAISGTANGAEDGQIVTVTVDGLTKTTTVNSNFWSLSFSATEIQSFAEGTLNINAAVSDAAGNVATPATQNIIYDKTPPSCVITSSDYSISRGETSTITFTFSKAITGFTEADVTVSNGNISTPLTTNGGLTWTATYTPITDIENATNVITVDNSGVTDNAGNTGSGLTNSPNYSIDTLSPTVTSILRQMPSVETTNADTLTFRVLFSEVMQNVDVTDFSVTGTSATISTVNALSGDTYDVTVSGGDLAALNDKVQLAFTTGQNINDSFNNPLTTLLPTSTNNSSYILDNFVAQPTLSLVSDTGSSNTDAITSNGTVSFSNLETGASWQWSSDSGITWTAGTGNSFSISGDGNKTVQVQQTDIVGNISTIRTLNLVLDTLVSTPTLSLAVDSGSDTNDKLTNNGTIIVAGLESGAKWEWSKDNANWNLGSSDRFTPTSDGAYQVFVRQTDVTGNISGNSTLNFVLDSTVLPPVLTLATAVGNATQTGVVNVSGIETNAVWQYSLDAGQTWLIGTGNNLTLSGDGDKNVIARQTDFAGNASVNSNALTFTLDTTATLPILSLMSDTGSDNFDRITNNGAVNVAGIESGATWQFSTDNQTWTTGTGNNFTLFGDGNKAVFLRQIDVVGNISPASLLTFTLDTQIPFPVLELLNDTGIKNNDAITGDGTVTVSNLENGANWQYSTDNGNTWTVGNGDRFTLYGDGNKTVLVKQTDLAGNNNQSAFNFTLDNQISPLSLVLARDTGKNNDAITSDGTVNVLGLEPNATWQYSVDGGNVWQMGNGSSLVLNGEGRKTLLVRQTDAAGNTSLTYAALDFVLDSRVEMPFLMLANDTGKQGDNLTKDGTVNVFGLENGARWQYSTDIGKSWITGSGSQFTLHNDGNKTIIVRQIDIAGNKNMNSMVLNFTLDTGIATPSAVLSNDSGKAANDFITRDGTFDVVGLEAGTNWRYSLDNGSSWLTGGDNHITLQGDGNKTVLIEQTDLAGNVSKTSSPLDFLLDTQINKPILSLATDSPNITDHAANVTGIETGATWEFSPDGIHWTTGSGNKLLVSDEIKSVLVRQTDVAGNVSDNARISFLPDVPTLKLFLDSGRKEDNITNNGTVSVLNLESGYFAWQYSTDNGKTWTRGSGNQFTLTGDGVKNVVATQIDNDGNVSINNGTLHFTLDTFAPPPTLALINDSGQKNDFITNDGAITVANLEPDASWQYSLDNGKTWTAGIEHRFTVKGEDGIKTVLVNQTDITGNLSANSELFTFTLDTQVNLPTVKLRTDSGNPTDNLTNDGTVVVSNLENGAHWQYSTDSGVTWLNGTNDSFVVTGDGNKTVLVRQTDLAGNTNLNSATLNFTLDTQVKTPTLKLVNDTGHDAHDNITTDGTLRIANLEQDATWEFSEDGKNWQNGTGDNFVITGDGYKSVLVRQTDTIGNRSATANLNFILDTQLKTPTLKLANDTGKAKDDSITADGTINVSDIEQGATWEFSEDGKTWTLESGHTTKLTTDGWHAVFVRQTDRAGNQEISQPLTATVDTTPPISDSMQRDNFELPSDSKPFTVQVNYSDTGSGIDTQTISLKDISVSGAENLTVANVTLVNNTATYTINAPKGGWQTADTGTYNIALNANEIRDIAGNSLQPLTVAKTFEIQPKKIIHYPDTTQHLVETDSILTTSGQIADLPKITAQEAIQGQFGTFNIDKLGNWTYATNSPHNEFLQDKVYCDTFPISTVDGVQSNVIIQITGTKDVPILVDDLAKQVLHETQIGNVTKNVLNGQVALQSIHAVPIAQNADKSWSDLDKTQLTFELKDSKSVGVDEAGHSLVQTTLKNGSVLTLNTWDGSYSYIPSAEQNTKEAIDQFEISADGVSLLLKLNHLDLSDLDGVSPDLETQLAVLATPIGEQPTGDLNHDNIDDKSQGGVVNIAWGTYQDFKAAQNNTLTSPNSIINIVVAKEKASEIDDTAQLSHIAVLPSDSSVIGGSKPPQSNALKTPWDPITFAVDATTEAGLTDMFPNREGLQTKIMIDVSRAGEKFNAYLKYVSAQTILFYNAAENPLITLDGEKLTAASQAGWYDFTQRTPDGDGARFVKAADGTVQQIEIILTDNAFGDDNPASNHFIDPAVPVIKNPPPIFEEKTLESATTVTALPTEFSHLILDETLVTKPVTKTEWIDNPLLCLPTWRQKLLHIPAKIEQLVTTIEKFTAPLNGTGNALNNQMTGNSADNILSGLAGKDILTGGAGADTFAYQNVSDSVNDAHDVITDFSELQGDKIDLSAVDANSNQAEKQIFHYIGTVDFTKQAAQLRFDSATHQLQGDTNGDGKAEFVIELSGVSNLASDALILKT